MTMSMHPLLHCTQRLAELRDNYLQKGTSNCLIGTDSDHVPSEECGIKFKRVQLTFWYKACTSLRASVRISNIFLEPSPVHMHARKRVCPCVFVCVCMKEMSIKKTSPLTLYVFDSPISWYACDKNRLRIGRV